MTQLGRYITKAKQSSSKVMRTFHRLTLGQKLWSGTLVFVILLAAVGSLVTFTQKETSDDMRWLIDREQPAIEKVLRLKVSIKEARANFALYLISENQQLLLDHQTSSQQILQDVEQLRRYFEHNKQADLASRVDQIKHQYQQIMNAEKLLLKIFADPETRQPGLAIATHTMSPETSLGIASLQNMLNSLRENSLGNENTEALFVKTSQIIYNWSKLSSEFRAYLLFRSPELAKHNDELIKLLEQQLEQLAQNENLDLDHEESIEHAIIALKSLKSAHQDLIAVHGEDAWRRDIHMIRTQIAPQLQTLDDLIDVTLQLVLKNVAAKRDHILQELDEQTNLTLAIMISGVALGLIFMWLVIGAVKKRISKSVDALKAVSESGNLNHTLAETGRDELTELALYFNCFVGKIRSVVDLVVLSSSSLANESSRMNQATQRSKEQISQQQLDIAEIAQAINHMSDSAEQMKNNAESAAAAALESSNQANDGKKVVSNVVAAIQQLSSEVANASGVIERINQDSTQIGIVMDVIRNISEQTNLLALNAAIEAARAGEQGRGFAVVADEVRTLSNRIHKETEQINQIISTLQQNATDAVDVMQRGSRISHEMVEKAQGANNALSTITQAASTITQMNTGIADLTASQNNHVDEVREKIDSITRIAQDSAQTAIEASNSSNEFTIMAGQLQDLVKQFLLENRNNTTQQPQAITSKHAASNANTVANNSAQVAEGDIELF